MSGVDGLIVMTALPPTYGHKALIDFAYSFLNGVDRGTLYVMVNSRSFEPLSGDIRVNALKEEFAEFRKTDLNIRFIHCAKDDVPQNPSEHPDFWNYWKNLVQLETGCPYFDFVFASETYGIELAKVLEAEFIPFDMKRKTVCTKGEFVRNNPKKYFEDMLPAIQKYYRPTVTIFGQESVGKSTMTKTLFSDYDPIFNVTRVTEWARDYLEQTGSEVTEHKMSRIVTGQYAIQELAHKQTKSHFIIQDTDLLSTLGYYRFWNKTSPHTLENMCNITKSDLYIVMNDKIPFEPDPLRYGGDKRETTKQFWIDLLEEFGCRYYVVKETDKEKQLAEIENVLYDLFNSQFEALGKFQRT